MNLEDLYTFQNELERLIFECDLIIKKLLVTGDPPTSAPLSTSDSKSVRLPKFETPAFDGKLTNWISFWEQFNALSDVEKLIYLHNSLKDGSAKGIIDGLSTSGKFYDEAIATLKARYDRLRLIHQSHVHTILEALSLKEGTGREIHRLHDTVSNICEPSNQWVVSPLAH